jgi:hypothetical protein
MGNQGNAGKGGLSILISLKIQHLFTACGIIGTNQAQWLILLGLPRGGINVVNIYAPNTFLERIVL